MGQHCARCSSDSHATAKCPKSFLRSFCKHCTRAGHDVEKCPLRKAQDYKRRKEEALQRTKQWVADGGLERKQKWEQWQERIEQETNASCSTASTVTQRRSLTDAEEKEARKYEKVLREIAKIEERVANGEKVDSLQLQKINRREEIQATLVMTKVRAGYLRSSA